MAKKLIINCDICDTRKATEATLAAYESILINCDDVLVNAASKELLSRFDVQFNCDNVVEVEGDVKSTNVNGRYQIKSTDEIPEKTFLMVNGVLEIGPGTQQVLKQYLGISVNGKAIYPESLSGAVGMLKVNGTVACYPDGAIVLKNNAVIDRTFTLRAKEKLYWSDKRMIIVDPSLNVEALVNKGATFSAGEVIIAEGLVEGLIDRIDEKARITIVPDGTAVVTNDLELDTTAIKRYGKKLCVLGDAKVYEEAGDALAEIAYLNIRGDVEVAESMLDRLMEAAAEISGKVNVMKRPRGRLFENKLSFRVSKWLLEQEKNGVSVRNCVKLCLDEDVPNELILERLQISGCASVICAPGQETAVAAVAENVANIGQQEEDGPFGGMLKGIKNALDTKVINADDYVL